MFLIDENMTSKETKKEMDEILKPIKLFCKRWNVQLQYEDDTVVMDAVAEKINELISLLEQQDDEQLQVRIDNFHRLELELDLFLKSLNHLKKVEIALIYYVLLVDKTQAELTEDEQMWIGFDVENVSASKINILYQEACLNLLELMKYNQIKQTVYKP